jgi:hypothetical protein
MNRFWRRRSARHSALTSTAVDWTRPVSGQPVEVAAAWPVRLDGSHSLSRGAVIRASILARLLGIPLLRLNADIALVPADFGPPGRVVPLGHAGSAGRAASGGLHEATTLLAHASRTLNGTRRAS